MTFDAEMMTEFDKYVGDVINSNNYASLGRYKSWEHCYIYFYDLHEKYPQGGDSSNKDWNSDLDLACLNLAFYLASWGMYRGSGFIYNYDYTIYREVVEVILKENELWNIDDFLVGASKTKEELYKLILNLGANINDALIKYKYPNKKDSEIEDMMYKKSKKIELTGTLITKIILGTIGCIPAFDSNFKKGVGFSSVDFCESNIRRAVEDATANATEIYNKSMKFGVFDSKRGLLYPIMKLLDIYYFEKGKKAND